MLKMKSDKEGLKFVNEFTTYNLRVIGLYVSWNLIMIYKGYLEFYCKSNVFKPCLLTGNKNQQVFCLLTQVIPDKLNTKNSK